MGFLTITNYLSSHISLQLQGKRFIGLSSRTLRRKVFRSNLKACAKQKKLRKKREVLTPPASDESDTLGEGSSIGSNLIFDNDVDSLNKKLGADDLTNIPSRSAVLQACTITSGLLLALGIVIRQACHIALIQGWEILDPTTKVSFDFETWHLELIAGLVILISSSRYLLLKVWPDFAKSSETANQQICWSLAWHEGRGVSRLIGILGVLNNSFRIFHHQQIRRSSARYSHWIIYLLHFCLG